jgi:small neutral amino acid transporter SnatA (MarC family)
MNRKKASYFLIVGTSAIILSNMIKNNFNVVIDGISSVGAIIGLIIAIKYLYDNRKDTKHK